MAPARKSSDKKISGLNDLLLRIGRNQDRTAFIEVFDEIAPKLKAYLMRTGSDSGVAEELVQEVMLTIWRKSGTFDPRQANATTWIFTIARNRRIDRYRREKRPELDPEEPLLRPSEPPDADEMLRLSQDTARLQEAIKELPQEQSELLRKAFFEEKAHSAIADETGLPLGTVKSRIRLALNRLRKTIMEPQEAMQ